MLIVEDEALIALNAQFVLEEAGFVVTGVAGSLAEARALAAARPPDVALVDLNLREGRTGLAVAAHLVEACACRVVLATGNPEGLDVGGGVVGVLAKPYTDDHLVAAVRAAGRAAVAAVARGPDDLGA